MHYKQTCFKEVNWRVNELYINPDISPEVDSIGIKITDTQSFRIDGNVLLSYPSTGVVSITWIFAYESRDTGTELLYLETEDTYSFDMGDKTENERMFKNIIVSSYQNTSERFDEKKEYYGLKNESMPILDSTSIDHVYLSLKSRLKI